MLGRLGRWCHNHRRLVVIVWIVGPHRALSARAVPPATPSPPSSSCPTSRASAGLDLLDAHFGGQGGGQTGDIVFRAPAGSPIRRCRSR